MPKYPNAILVVEDDAYLSKIIVNRLKEEGFLVQSADDGVSALLMTKAQQFSLILLDLLMPVMNGFDFLRRLKEDNLKIPVIVLSNLSHDRSKEEAKELGADSFYVKSDISIDDVVNKVKKFLGL